MNQKTKPKASTRVKVKVKPKAAAAKKNPRKTKKMMDVSKPDPTQTSSLSPHLDIPKRPMMQEDATPGAPGQSVDVRLGPPSAPPLATSKKSLVVPVKIDGEPAEDKPDDAKITITPPKDAAQGSSSPIDITVKPAAESQPPADKPSDDKTDEKPSGSAEDGPAEAGAAGSASDAISDSESPDLGSASDEQTKQAAAEADAALKRDRELEDLISKREYNVPINSVARRRSIHASAAMTLLIVLLAVVLIDLMLDSGMIILVQKIPHTHFFTNCNVVVRE